MNNNNMEILFTDVPAREADLIILILTSQNIKTSIEKQNSVFNILVEKEDKEQSVLRRKKIKSNLF